MDLGAQFFLTKENVGKNVSLLSLHKHTESNQTNTLPPSLSLSLSFFFQRAEAIEKRVFDLNPRVRIETLTQDIREQPQEFFDGYNIVCLIGYDLNTAKRINDICREKNIKFYAADTIGLFGYVFCDCQEHSYIEEIQVTTSNGASETKKTAKASTYTSLTKSFETKFDKIKPRDLKRNWMDALFGIHILLEFEAKHQRAPIAHDATDLETLLAMKTEYFQRRGIADTTRCDKALLSDLQTYYASKAELSPICAVVGGLLAQDILKVLGGKDLPVKNWFVLDGRDLTGMVHDV
jgi:ubiquitin-like 1-activating enzyme E1 A